MQAIWNSKGKKVHTRKIEVSTYEYDGDSIIVEGSLRDERFQESHVITGETFSKGVVHHMVARLRVNCSSLVIEDVDVDLITVPREECRETIGSLTPVKGLTIARGFTSKVKKLTGGNRGCAHLVELILAMAPAAFQGFGAHQARNPVDYQSAHARMVLGFLVDTCRVWRDGGPFVEDLRKKTGIT
ncbi:MAG: DUF2889 domain-containing protein [Thermodesulfobacteriota bacterium]